MDVEHDPLPLVVVLLPFMVVRAHLDPFGTEGTGIRLAPLPPLASADFPYAFRAKLGLEGAGRVVELFDRDRHLVDLDPLGVRDPLGSEGLDLLDSMRGDIFEKGPDQVQPLIVGQMRSRPLVERLAVDVLPVMGMLAGSRTLPRGLLPSACCLFVC